MSEDSLENRLFVGRFDHVTDQKGRVIIPSEFRNVVAARNNSCKAVWLVPEKRNGVPYIACYDEKCFDKKREGFFGADVECATPDKQGRVIVKQRQREYAKLDKKIVVAASPDMESFEIWNEENFGKAYKPVQKSVDSE